MKTKPKKKKNHKGLTQVFALKWGLADKMTQNDVINVRPFFFFFKESNLIKYPLPTEKHKLHKLSNYILKELYTPSQSAICPSTSEQEKGRSLNEKEFYKREDFASALLRWLIKAQVSIGMVENREEITTIGWNIQSGFTTHYTVWAGLKIQQNWEWNRAKHTITFRECLLRAAFQVAVDSTRGQQSVRREWLGH